MTGPLPRLFEDDVLLVLDKPSGLPVHRGYTGERDNVAERLRRHGPHPFHTVHRLDRGTSGVLVVARDEASARALTEAFTARDVAKTYLALVRGQPGDDIDIDHPVPSGPDKGAPRAEARTHVTRLATVTLEGSTMRETRYSLLIARPETGRFHQIRRHLAHIAHPIIGDGDHGRPDHNRLLKARVGLARLALHAMTIELTHPRSGERIELRSPIPTDLAEPLSALGFDLASLPQLAKHLREAASQV